MPGTRSVHIDAALTQVSVGYRNLAFIGDRILKEVYADKQSDKYWVFGQDIFDTVDDRIRPLAVANEIDWDLSTDTYFADGHALRQGIPDRLELNQDPGIDVLTQTTENVMERLDLNREKRIADLVFNTGTYAVGHSTTLSASGQWSHEDSNPAIAIKTAKKTVHKQVGVDPNVLILGKEVYDELCVHPRLIELVKYAQVGILTNDLLKRLLDVPEILVGEAIHNTARKGQTRSFDYVWGRHAALVYVPERPAQKVPAFGYTFIWNAPGGEKGRVVYRYRVDERKATFVEAERYEDHKIVVQQAGYMFKNAVA